MSAARAREAGEMFGPRMTLFADVLSVGVVTAVSCLPLVTVPAALSTACAVLRGAGEGRPATAVRYFALLRRRLRPGDLAAGLVALAGVLLLMADAALAGAGLPGARVFAVAAAVIGAYALAVGARSCGRPESLTDWRQALRHAARDTTRDPGGSGLVLLALAAAVLCAWTMVPLAFVAPGPLALALTAVDVRHRVSAARAAPGAPDQSRTYDKHREIV
ncbi:hypothetical protein ACIOJD_31150 [Streptomyces sp. NPDC088116]|uniref:hypothetical protein n=1 Tax=Streptomyces sp. NPDC088116 TaxID=3365825 RepID=UPI003819E262